MSKRGSYRPQRSRIAILLHPRVSEEKLAVALQAAVERLEELALPWLPPELPTRPMTAAERQERERMSSPVLFDWPDD